MHPSALFYDAVRIGVGEPDSDDESDFSSNDEVSTWAHNVERRFQGIRGRDENNSFCQRRLDFDESTVVRESVPRSAVVSRIRRVLHM